MKNLIVCFIVVAIVFPVIAIADELVVFSGRKDKFIKPVAEEFTRQTGIKVLLHTAKSTALLNKLKLEGERTDADLYISNDAGNLQKGADLGLFKVLPSRITQTIPKNYRAEDGTWLGLSARARVLVVNTKSALADQVHSVFDLADLKLKDKIAITHSANGSFIAGVTVYMLKKGEQKTLEWMKGLKENAGRYVYNKHSKVVKAVASGRVEVGLVNHYYIYRHLAKHPDAPIKIVIPDQGDEDIGVAWNVAGVAVSKYSKKMDEAIKFVEFLASAKGQQMFSEINKEYPTLKNVKTAEEIPALSTMKVADVAMSKLGSERNATIDLIEKSGLQ